MKTALIALLAALSLAACKEPTTQAPASAAPSEKPVAAEPIPVSFPKIKLSGAKQDIYDGLMTSCAQTGSQAGACVMEAFRDQERENALIDGRIRKGEGGPFVKTWLDDYMKHADGEPGKSSSYLQCQMASQDDPSKLLLCALAELDWIDLHLARLVDYQDAATQALSKIPTKTYNVQGD